MKKMFRKALALMLTVCMAVGLLAAPGLGKREVRAAEVSGDYEYVILSDGMTIRITRYIGSSEKVIIPSTIEEKHVEEIGEHAFEGCIELKEVTVPNSVVQIQSYAFNKCTNLAEITIPSSVVNIGSYVFTDCLHLNNIYFTGTEGQWKNLIEMVPTVEKDDALQTAIKTYTYNNELQYGIYSGGSIFIAKYVGVGSNAVVNIPEQIDGRNVISIGGIGDFAFRDCTDVIKIVIPKSVHNIGFGAFKGCTSLMEINIPDGVTSIDNNTFEGCKNLREINIPDSVTSIGNWAFDGCKSLTVIKIPNSVVSIDYDAFFGCTGLTQINIPDGLTDIEAGTFTECRNLTEISIPISVKNIEDRAFYNCSRLSDVYYAGTADQWMKIAISSTGNERLQNATIHCAGSGDFIYENSKYKILDDDTVEIAGYVGDGALVHKGIPNTINGVNLTSIGKSCFAGCDRLASIEVLDNVNRIMENAFKGCERLTDVYYSGSKSQWEKIVIDPTGNEALLKAEIHYAKSDELTSGDYKYKVLDDGTVEITKYIGSDTAADIPEKIEGKRVAGIGDLAFFECEGLTEITIPSNVAYIGKSAFCDCKNLEHITIPTGVPEIKWGTFTGCANLKKITIPASVKNLRAAFNNCTALSDVYYLGTEKQWEEIEIVTVGNENLLNATVHYIDSSKNYEYIVLDDGTVEITKYVGLDTVVDVPAKIGGKSVTSIGIMGLSHCRDLIKITLPESVRNVGMRAFQLCENLTEVNLPDKITQIGEGAFYNCKKLTHITIPEPIRNIHPATFYGCASLEEVTIPDNVVTISLSAFLGCEGLKEVVIPDSVTVVLPAAFRGCIGLQDVYYTGTKEQWEKIVFYSEIKDDLKNTIIHYNHGIQPDKIENVVNAKQALESLKVNDALCLLPAFQPYLSDSQIDTMESYLYTWLAEINYAYRYSGSSGVKERIMKKAGIDPQGDFASGREKAITHISVDTKYGKKTFEITLDLGKPDGNGNLYPSYGAMHYEALQKGSIPSDISKAGQIGKNGYADIGTFVQSVSRSAEDTLHGTYQWKSLEDEMTAGVLADKTIAEIIGNKNGSFSDGTFVIYEKPLFTYSKKVTIACPVDVRVFTMDGKGAGSVVGNKVEEKDGHVRLDVNGETKTVYLSGNDYYLDLQGTGTGKMNYTVEEMANEDVCRNVQFLELQLKKDLQYEGYVFRPLNIDSDLYALRKVERSEKETVFSDKDSYEALFKKVQGLTLSHGEATLDKNRKVQLNATLYPLDASNKGLQWTADNQSVLSVDENGLVTAVGAGSATVTVSTKDGSFLKQYCVFNVKGGDNGNNNGDGSGGNGANGNGTGSNGGNGSNGNSSNGNGTGGSGSNGSNGNGTGSNGGSGSNGNSSNGNGAGNSGSPGTSDNAPDNSKPSLEPETPPVVTALHYVLQFQTNGGVNLSRRTMTLLADDNPGIMPKIQKKGYVFDGWYTQQSGGERITGDKPLKAAATLYAHWTKAKAPKKASAPTLKSKKKGKLKVTYKKIKGAAGYELQYSADKKFSSKKTKRLGKSENGKTISGLKAGKKYYARVRAYNVDSMGNKLYGKYSKAKGVKIKG